VPTQYYINTIHDGADRRVSELESSLRETLREFGLHLTVAFEFTQSPGPGSPEVSVFFGTTEAVKNPDCIRGIEAALASGSAVIPVTENEGSRKFTIPESLERVNCFFWETGLPGLVRLVLEQLGIEESQRRVFISHRRQDGLLMAEQLHDQLSHHRFDPFIDRFAIPPGADVQRVITDSLDSFAFLLLIESPKAPESDWVFYEVEYALYHYMGIYILSWPGAPLIPGTVGLPRYLLADTDLIEDNGYQTLSPNIVPEIVQRIEEEHARGIVRRRQNLLASVRDALEDAGKSYTQIAQWQLLVRDPDEVVAVTPRLPSVTDLYEIDQLAVRTIATRPTSAIVHTARRMDREQKDLLEWAVDGRTIALIPDNAIGAYWS
jgi:hypothetical protein